MALTLAILRYLIFALFMWAALVGIGSWALRERRINPFGRLARLIRGLSEPVLQPIERWQIQRGGNPQNAPWWLLGVTVGAGIVVITGAEWLLNLVAGFAAAASSGPRGVVRMIVFYVGQVVLLSLVIRVVGSWFGAGRFNKWIGWTYKLTDWIVEPLRRIIPPIGFIDITPLVAWFLLQVLLQLVMRLI